MPIQQTRFRSLFNLALIVVAAGLSGCGLLTGNPSDCSRDMLLILELVPPTQATFIDENCSMGIINPTYRATLTIAAADLAAFQQTTHVTDWQATADKAVSMKDEAARALSLVFGQFGDGIISEEVLIDTSNPQQYTVYVERVFVD